MKDFGKVGNANPSFYVNFLFSWYSVVLKLINLNNGNDVGNRKEEGRECAILLHVI